MIHASLGLHTASAGSQATGEVSVEVKSFMWCWGIISQWRVIVLGLRGVSDTAANAPKDPAGSVRVELGQLATQ